MLIRGSWLFCEDRILRPVIAGAIRTADGSWQKAEFLVDVGAGKGGMTYSSYACP
jgi:hypothetical protein